MKKYINLTFIFLVFNTCVSEEKIHERMISFDEALIPVWYHASKGDIEKAQMSVPVLEERWYELQDDYQNIIGPRIAWEETYECVTELATAAIQAVEYEEMKDAVDYLEAINFELMNLRMEYGVDHTFDKIWEFKLSYDLIEKLVGEYYYLFEAEEFDCLLGEVNGLWQVVKADSFVSLNWERKKNHQSQQIKNRIERELDLLINTNEKRTAEQEEFGFEFDALTLSINQLICLFGDFGAQIDVAYSAAKADISTSAHHQNFSH